MTGKYLVGAAGMAVGALLTLMVGSWTTSAQETRETAVSYRDAGDVRSLSVVRPVAARRPVATRNVVADAPVRRTSTSVVRTEPKRSWQKTALVIGGSAGAGAGVGALAGGKKGALIGAAIGGGAASLFEAIKRK
ncbi:MAG TPA: hypothetical protein VN700_02895 [Vicinamibacterales bacterium]|nr:hypothetical protein [Vicinamibacterales bacterium]